MLSTRKKISRIVLFFTFLPSISGCAIQSPDPELMSQQAQPLGQSLQNKERTEVGKFEHAVQLFASGHVEEAQSLLRQIVSGQSDNVDARILLAKTYVIRGDLLSALTEYQKLTSMNLPPLQNARIVNGRGVIQFRLRRFKDALESFEEAISINRTDRYILNKKSAAAKLAEIQSAFSAGNNIQARERLVLINYFAKVNKSTIAVLLDHVLTAYSQGYKRFRINLYSSGGSPTIAMAAFYLLKDLPITITTHNVGKVNSAAIILYCLGERRTANVNSIFLFHASKWRSKEYRTANNMKAYIRRIRRSRKQLKHIYDGCFKPEFKLADRYFLGGDDWYITPSEGADIGLVTDTTEQEAVPSKIYTIH